MKLVDVKLSCFRILIELVVDTEDVSPNSDCEVFHLKKNLTGSKCALFSCTTCLIHMVCYVSEQENQSPARGILIASGLNHIRVYT